MKILCDTTTSGDGKTKDSCNKLNNLVVMTRKLYCCNYNKKQI